MQFTPKTEEQLIEESLYAEGDYDFEVADAADKVSKNGNDMIWVKLKVWGADSSYRFVEDYLMEKMQFKLIHFCEATGLTERYESGALVADDVKGRAGKVKLKIEPAGDYPAKNAVKDYVVDKAKRGISEHSVAKGNAFQPQSAPADLDDEIPF